MLYLFIFPLLFSVMIKNPLTNYDFNNLVWKKKIISGKRSTNSRHLSLGSSSSRTGSHHKYMSCDMRDWQLGDWNWKLCEKWKWERWPKENGKHDVRGEKNLNMTAKLKWLDEMQCWKERYLQGKEWNFSLRAHQLKVSYILFTPSLEFRSKRIMVGLIA